jgi:hypothetical protein
VSKSGEPISGEAVEREAARRNHDVWYQQQRLNLIASDPVRAAALALTKALYRVTFKRDRLDMKLWQYVEPIQEKFLLAAREDLGTAISRPALRSDSRSCGGNCASSLLGQIGVKTGSIRRATAKQFPSWRTATKAKRRTNIVEHIMSREGSLFN